MGDTQHVGVSGGGVLPIALTEPLDNAEEAIAKLSGVGRNAGDELRQAG